MKRIVTEVSGEGLESFLGQRVELWCLNYIYAGDLVGVNDVEVRLDNPVLVYETGELTAAKYANAQPLTGPRYIRLATVESYGPGR